jgi:molybdenum cofactor cytidylyltransferase
MIAAVVLAAGAGSRFGATKQLEMVGGRALVRHSVDAARDSGIELVVVVVGHDADAVIAAAGDGVEIVRNERWADGQSSSLRAGLDALGDRAEAAVVLPADQPGIGAEHVRTLLEAAGARSEPIVRLRFADAPGPALLRRAIWDDVRALSGDIGARAVAERRPDVVFEATIASAAPIDVDTPEDLERVRRDDGPGREKPPSF